MSKFTKQFKKEYTFDGDIITVVMKRLKRKSALKLAPMSEYFSAGEKKLDFKDSLEFMDLACEMLMENIVSMSNFVDGEGNKLNKEDVVGEEAESYFMELVSDMMNDLMSESFAGEKAKKLESSQENTLKTLKPTTDSLLEGS